MDLDADPVAIAELLEADALWRRSWPSPPVVARRGIDGAELAVRAILGQQVSVVAARTHTARLVRSAGTPLPQPDGGLTHLFPEAGAVADADPAALAMPESRRRTLRMLAGHLHDGSITIDAGADLRRRRGAAHRAPRHRPWTAAYIALRGARRSRRVPPQRPRRAAGPRAPRHPPTPPRPRPGRGPGAPGARTPSTTWSSLGRSHLVTRQGVTRMTTYVTATMASPVGPLTLLGSDAGPAGRPVADGRGRARELA